MQNKRNKSKANGKEREIAKKKWGKQKETGKINEN